LKYHRSGGEYSVAYDGPYSEGGQLLLRTGKNDFPLPTVKQVAHYPALNWPIIAMTKEFSPQTRSGKHSHDRAQLLFAIKGLMVAKTEEGTWAVPEGYALWMPARLRHDVSMHGEVIMRTAYVRSREAARLSPHCQVLQIGLLLQAALAALADEVCGLRKTVRADHLIWLVLDEIQRAASASFVLPLPKDNRLSRLAHALISDAGSAKTIDQWCDLVGVSRRTLTRLFRAETGISFGEWRRRLRILTAAARVADGEHLAKVAASLGYQNVAAFRTMARRHFGDYFQIHHST
jgi:AraC-like DNA-binding protein